MISDYRFEKKQFYLVLGFIVLFVTLLFVSPLSVQADVAPPPKPAGSNPYPGDEITQVRMEEETVLISVSDLYYEDSLGKAFVTATFHMRNIGDGTEEMYVRFPINTGEGYPIPSEIEDLVVRVDGKEVDTSVVEDEFKWEEFFVAFPPQEEVIITVKYTLEATGYAQESFVQYGYVLETGSGWKGTIGSVDIILRLPYEASPQNVFLHSHPGGSIEGNDVRWHYDDLEPERKDNFQIMISKPVLWKLMLEEKENVRNDPSDDEAWGRLAKAYKELSMGIKKWPRGDQGGVELFYLSMDAYDQAVTLDPDDALWHAGYGDLLVWSSEWCLGFSPSECRDFLVKGMQEYHRAYTLDPDNEKINELLEEQKFMMNLDFQNGQYIFLGLTQTPTLKPTFTSTAAIEATPRSTQKKNPTSTPVPEKTSSSISSPIPSQTLEPVTQTEEDVSKDESTPKFCTSLILFPVIGVLFFFTKRKKSLLHTKDTDDLNH